MRFSTVKDSIFSEGVFGDVKKALFGLQQAPAFRTYYGFAQRWSKIFQQLTKLGVVAEPWSWDAKKNRIIYSLDLSSYPELAQADPTGVHKLFEQAGFFDKAKAQFGKVLSGAQAKLREDQVKQVRTLLAQLKALRGDMKAAGYEMDPLQAQGQTKWQMSFLPGEKDWAIIGQHPDFQKGKDVSDPDQRARATGQEILDAIVAGKMQLEKLTREELIKIAKWMQIDPIQHPNITGFIAQSIAPKVKYEDIISWITKEWIDKDSQLDKVPAATLTQIIKSFDEEPLDYSQASLAKQAFDIVKAGKSTEIPNIIKMDADQVINFIGKKRDMKTLNLFADNVPENIAKDIFSEKRIDQRKKQWKYELAGWAAQRLMDGTMEPQDAYEDELIYAWKTWEQKYKSNKGKLAPPEDFKLDTLRAKIAELQDLKKSSVKNNVLQKFHRELSKQLNANTELKTALQSMKNQYHNNAPMWDMIDRVTSGGQSLSSSMKATGENIFSNSYIDQIESWEQSGSQSKDFKNIRI